MNHVLPTVTIAVMLIILSCICLFWIGVIVDTFSELRDEKLVTVILVL